jgi:ADP-L-glycero-D-manno-heptose 6-epimerase
MSGRIVVTGGAGFIGSNLVRALNARGQDNILVVDDLGKDAKWRNLRGLEFADYLEKDDFRFAVRHDALSDIDAVFHLGACSSTTETNASFLADNNYRFSVELCEWCLDHDARFIYASSAATYGDGAQGYSDAPELMPSLRPLNPYGFSKHLFDLWAARRGLLQDSIAGLKYFNVYGPGEAHKGDMRSMIHKAWGQIRETGRVRLFRSHRPDYPDGGQDRDFLHVRDAVAATLYFHDRRDVNGLYNCGTGRARTWNDLAHAVFAAMNRPPEIEYIDMPEAIRDAYQYHTEADLTRLREAGFEDEFTSLEEGVREYVQDHLEAGE